MTHGQHKHLRDIRRMMKKAEARGVKFAPWEWDLVRPW